MERNKTQDKQSVEQFRNMIHIHRHTYETQRMIHVLVSNTMTVPH